MIGDTLGNWGGGGEENNQNIGYILDNGGNPGQWGTNWTMEGGGGTLDNGTHPGQLDNGMAPWTMGGTLDNRGHSGQ